MIAITNVKKVEYPDIQHIACHRPHILGNPFVIGKDGNREDVISKYKVFLNEQIKNGNEKIIQALREIETIYCKGEGVCLDCYCAPQICHTEVIRACVLNNVVCEIFGGFQSKSYSNLLSKIIEFFGCTMVFAATQVREWVILGLITPFLETHYEYQSLGFQRF